MFGLSKDYELENITIKIDNRKRKNCSDSPPMSRMNHHSSVNINDGSSDDRRLTKYVHRRSRTPTSLPITSRHSKYDKFGQSRDLNQSHRTYKVLCVSTLHPKVNDNQIKEILYQEYRKFGEFSVKISYEQNERLVYVCFKSSKDARDAKHSKRVIDIFDNLCLVKPVYESYSYKDHHKSKTRHSQLQNLSTDFKRYCPISTEIHGSLPTDRFYKMLPYDAFPSMQSPLAFREISLPPFYSHELMIHQQPLYEPQRHHIPSFRSYPHSNLIHDKKKKFPNYLHHIPPEDDPLATCTLFVGNLEISITHYELQCRFGKYGVIEDIDVKRPLAGTGNSYAFVRFQNLDMAHKAKVELSGQYFGKYQCKIGYGKLIPTRQIWVGGLDPCTSLTQLEREFNRFGVVQKIKYVNGDISAHILFESIDSALTAVEDMRGVALKGSKYRLRIDYANEDMCSSPMLTYSSKSKSSQNDSAEDLLGLTRQNDSDEGLQKLIRQDDSDGGSLKLTRQHEYPSGKSVNDNTFCSYKSHPKDHHENSLSLKQHSVSDISFSISPLYQSIDSDVKFKKEVIQSVCFLDSVLTPEDLALKCTDMWHGSFIFKNCQFPTSFHLTSGDINILETIMKNEDCKSKLHITQRLPLGKSALEDISKCITTTNMDAIFLALPCSTNCIFSDDASIQIKPFQNLVFYLKNKGAAGVSLIRKDLDLSNYILFVFPPCEYSIKILKESAKNLNSDALKFDDYLVVIVINKNYLV